MSFQFKTSNYQIVKACREQHYHNQVAMVDRLRRLTAAPPPELAKPPNSRNGNTNTLGMLVGFVSGILTVMVLALLYCLFRRKVIPLLKQRRGLTGEKFSERNLDFVHLW